MGNSIKLKIPVIPSRCAQLSVGIPIKFAECYLKSMGIATPVCGLVRNDVV